MKDEIEKHEPEHYAYPVLSSQIQKFVRALDFVLYADSWGYFKHHPQFVNKRIVRRNVGIKRLFTDERNLEDGAFCIYW